MLSKKDEAKIRKIIQEELKDALFREITVERNIPDKKGDVPGRIEKSTSNLLDMLVVDVPRLAQSVAGAEEAANQARNRSIEALEKVNILGKTIAAVSGSIKTMARFSKMLDDMGLLDQLQQVTVAQQEDIKAIGQNEGNT